MTRSNEISRRSLTIVKIMQQHCTKQRKLSKSWPELANFLRESNCIEFKLKCCFQLRQEAETFLSRFALEARSCKASKYQTFHSQAARSEHKKTFNYLHVNPRDLMNRSRFYKKNHSIKIVLYVMCPRLASRTLRQVWAQTSNTNRTPFRCDKKLKLFFWKK